MSDVSAGYVWLLVALPVTEMTLSTSERALVASYMTTPI